MPRGGARPRAGRPRNSGLVVPGFSLANFKKRRRASGFTQQQIAGQAGISRSVVRDVELGRIEFRGEQRLKLWKALKLLEVIERIELSACA